LGDGVLKLAINPENSLAKFGYQVDMKVERKQNRSIFLATYSNLSLKISDLDLFLFIYLFVLF
jgi:hypothetical protein